MLATHRWLCWVLLLSPSAVTMTTHNDCSGSLLQKKFRSIAPLLSYFSTADVKSFFLASFVVFVATNYCNNVRFLMYCSCNVTLWNRYCSFSLISLHRPHFCCELIFRSSTPFCSTASTSIFFGKFTLLVSSFDPDVWRIAWNLIPGSVDINLIRALIVLSFEGSFD